MRVAVTGTPGTGKTTAVSFVETDLEVVHANDVIREEGLYTEVDEGRGSLVADLDALSDWLDEREVEGSLVESHLSHHLDPGTVIVLRCRPDLLESRLRERGGSAGKASENAEAEALDLVLSEAVSGVGIENVYEIDTTESAPESVAREVERVLAGEREPSAGEVDYGAFV
ncbi:adenylate kinase family protein [Natronorarus salvus]|uniref:adenylate kinase family protein n=1 Tax=Natronorarus salvus TaxID=3117733 RepID=UPI002F25F1AB